jgi:hypothetical protein
MLGLPEARHRLAVEPPGARAKGVDPTTNKTKLYLLALRGTVDPTRTSNNEGRAGGGREPSMHGFRGCATRSGFSERASVCAANRETKQNFGVAMRRRVADCRTFWIQTNERTNERVSRVCFVFCHLFSSLLSRSSPCYRTVGRVQVYSITCTCTAVAWCVLLFGRLHFEARPS